VEKATLSTENSGNPSGGEDSALNLAGGTYSAPRPLSDEEGLYAASPRELHSRCRRPPMENPGHALPRGMRIKILRHETLPASRRANCVI